MPSPRRKRADWLQFGNGTTYFHRVHRPLQCLVFIVPLLLFYQIGSVIDPFSLHSTMAPGNLKAFQLLLGFFRFLGAAGDITANVLPLLAVIAILISWHLARKDPWDFEPKLYLGMAVESIIWGIPFFVIGLAVLRLGTTPAAAAAGGLTVWQQVVLSTGAGVYEELLFRLIAINLLSIIFVDVAEMKESHAITLIILISALLFSAYHLLVEPFNPGVFAFRAAMGIYLAGVYIYRGFGISVGAHTVYDLLVVTFLTLHASS